MNDEMNKNEKWCENVILIDADYIDKVAFDLTVNFERMIMRPIGKADLAHWIDCVALDGGVHEGDNKIQVIFLHNKNISSLEYLILGSPIWLPHSLFYFFSDVQVNRLYICRSKL